MTLAKILLRGGTSAEWAAANPVLAARKLAVDTTSKRVKVGDGQNAWSALPWVTMDAAEVARLEAAATALDAAADPYDAATATVLGMQNGASWKVLTDTIDAATTGTDAAGARLVPTHVPQPGKFDILTSTYNVNALSMAPWFAALARVARGGANAHQVNHGDSITRGAGTSAPYPVTAWTARYINSLVNTWMVDEGWNAFNDEGNVAADPNTVITGFTRSGSKGLYQEARVSAGNGNTIVISGKIVRKFRILYEIAADGGSFTYQATGEASATTVNTATGTPGIGSIVTTANAQVATRSLTITALGANVTILAVQPIVADTGRVVVTRAGRNGAKINNITDDPAGMTVSALDVLTYIPADLLVLFMETNDFDQQTSLATYKSRLQTAISQQQAKGGAVLLVATIPPNRSRTIPLEQYTRVLYELADANNVGLLDMQHRWRSVSKVPTSVDPLSFYTDELHPSDAGAVDIAASVFGAVIPAGFGQRRPLSLDASQAFTALQRFGFPGHGSEQIDIGGADLYAGNNAAPTVPYVMANNLGSLWLAAKTGQDIFLRSRARMEGNLPFQFAAVTTAQRPTTGLSDGACVFDTTLGKPVYRSGSGWVDATGASV